MPNKAQDNEKQTADLTPLPLEQIAEGAELEIVVLSPRGEVEYGQGGPLKRPAGSGFIHANDRLEAVDERTILRSAESVRIKSDSMECATSMSADRFLTIADLLAPALEYAHTVMNHREAEVFYFDDWCKISGVLSHVEEGHASTKPIRVELDVAAGKRAVLISFCTRMPRCRLHHLRSA